MKRMFAVIIAFLVLSGFALADEEIRFLDYPWGITYAELSASLEERGLEIEKTRDMSYCDITPITDLSFIEDVGYAARIEGDISVGGYPVNYLYMNFLFEYGDDWWNPEIDDSTLIEGTYYLDIIDRKATADDLVDKLSQLYGEYEYTEEIDEKNTYSEYVYWWQWEGANNTYVALGWSYDIYDMETQEHSNEFFYIRYGRTNNREMVESFDQARQAQAIQEENQQREESTGVLDNL